MIYLRLTLQNARRAAGDYLLYLMTLLVFIVIIMASNLISLSGSKSKVPLPSVGGTVRDGFQSASLPLLVCLAAALLLSYINSFLLTRRSKEFGLYILMGMKRSRIALLFFIETLLLSVISLIAGILLGYLGFSVLSSWLGAALFAPAAILTAAGQTILYFGLIQLVLLLVTVRRVKRMQIRGMLTAKKQNQKIPVWKKKFWLPASLLCFLIFMLLIGAAAFGGNEDLMMIAVSVISVPLLMVIFGFYQLVFIWLDRRRSRIKKEAQLYITAQLLARGNTTALFNGLLSSCLLFSLMAFLFGLLLTGNDLLFDSGDREWMAFAQVSICILFLVIYFAILGIRQIVSFQSELPGLNVLNCLGKNQATINRLIFRETAVGFLMPAAAVGLLVLTGGVPLGISLSGTIGNNDLFILLFVYILLFALLLTIYLLLTCRICKNWFARHFSGFQT